MIGYCLGGGYALLLVPGPGYAAVSTSYGGCPKDAEAVLDGACPIVGSYGGRTAPRWAAAPQCGRRAP